MPESSITARKIKHSPLKDVAGMIRSFHYAVCAKLYFSAETQNVNPERLQKAADLGKELQHLYFGVYFTEELSV